jgi:DNA-binding MarR family transcriptional regulator
MSRAHLAGLMDALSHGADWRAYMSPPPPRKSKSVAAPAKATPVKGLTAPQEAILDVLCAGDALASEITEVTGLSGRSVGQNMTNMVIAGYVERAPRKVKRLVLWRITDAGRAIAIAPNPAVWEVG